MVFKKPTKDPSLEWFLSHCHIHKYPPKKNLIYEGYKPKTLYYITKGSVVVFIKNDEEKELILSYLNDGDFIGEMGLFKNEKNNGIFVRSKTNCEIAEISYMKFEQLIKTNLDILIKISSQIVHRLKATSKKLGNFVFFDARKRIEQILKHLTNQPNAITHPDGMQIKITRQEIGQLVGCSRETAGRILKILENQKLIETHGKTILVYGTR